MSATRVFACLAGLFLVSPANGDDRSEPRTHYKRAMSAYALGDFPTAAAEYEAAFKLEPDPALLYNAAQAHRVGGNARRALELYQSYLRMFGDQANRGETERHIADLKIAIEKQRSAAEAPPLATAPMQPAEPQATLTPETTSAPEKPPEKAPERRRKSRRSGNAAGCGAWWPAWCWPASPSEWASP
jgi:iron complex outermembrane receptor protein